MMPETMYSPPARMRRGTRGVSGTMTPATMFATTMSYPVPRLSTKPWSSSTFPVRTV